MHVKQICSVNKLYYYMQQDKILVYELTLFIEIYKNVLTKLKARNSQ